MRRFHSIHLSVVLILFLMVWAFPTQTFRMIASHPDPLPDVSRTLQIAEPSARAATANDQPYRMATDRAGNIYVSDLFQHRSMRYDLAGTLTGSYGTGATGTALGDLPAPQGIARIQNTILIADSTNNRVTAFDAWSGSALYTFGTGLSEPRGVAAAPDENAIYVVESGVNRVTRFQPNGSLIGSFGSAGTANGQFNTPSGVAVDSLGYVYVADFGNDRVQKFTAGGTFIRAFSATNLDGPDGIAIDAAGMVYVTTRLSRCVVMFDPTGFLNGSYCSPLNTSSAPATDLAGLLRAPGDVTITTSSAKPQLWVSDISLNRVWRFGRALQPNAKTWEQTFPPVQSDAGGIVADAQGNVYVSFYNLNIVRKYTQGGGLLLEFGGFGAGDGQLHGPRGLALNADGELFVAEYLNNRVSVYSSSGAFLRKFGSAGGGTGQFSLPAGVAVDSFNQIYVLETGNNRVQKFDQAGNYLRQWGTTGTENGQFNSPIAITVDSRRGWVYVVEFSGNRAQLFTSFGDFVAVFADSTAGPGSVNTPVGITSDQRGNIYIADRLNNRIAQYDGHGTYVRAYTPGVGTANGQFNGNLNAVYLNSITGQLYTGETMQSRVQRFGSPNPRSDTLGVWRPANQTFYLRKSNTQGFADFALTVSGAASPDLPVIGDWNGDGVDTGGIYRPANSAFYLFDTWRAASIFSPAYTVVLGNPGDRPIAGDWDADGADGVGTYRPSNGILYLRNRLTSGFADYAMILGNPSDLGVAGDWNGDGQDSAGIFRPNEARFYLSDANTSGVIFGDYAVSLGNAGDTPFTGDWVRQGFSGLGVFRPTNGFLYLKNALTTGFADVAIFYGAAGDVGLGGVWGSFPLVPDSVPGVLPVILVTKSGPTAVYNPEPVILE